MLSLFFFFFFLPNFFFLCAKHRAINGEGGKKTRHSLSWMSAFARGGKKEMKKRNNASNIVRMTKKQSGKCGDSPE